MVRDLEIRFPKGYCSSIKTASNVQTQEIANKNIHPIKAKIQDPKPALSYANVAKTSEQSRKDKKKKTKKCK